MPFDGREEMFTTTLPKHESGGWRNLYSHPTMGTDWGDTVWPTKDAAAAAVIFDRNNGNPYWSWRGSLVVLKEEVADTQIRWEE